VVHRFILHNDRICEASEAVLSPGQVGVLSGWGVFSTFRVADGVLFAFDRHWARMQRDAAALHVPMTQDPERVRRKLHDLVEANQVPDCTLRLAILRNAGGLWTGPSTGRESDVLALTANTKDWGSGVRLGYVKNGRHAASPFAGTKILSWAMNLTWAESAHARGLDEVLLLNERGEVAECTSANVFVANGDHVWTPPLSSGCLPGITREVLLGEIHVPGIRIGEKALMPADLESADEVFITSTTRNLLPVLEIEGKKVGGAPRIQAALEKAFEDFVQQYLAQHKEMPAGR
jgi:branched-chain amino acid aminotransferase